MGKNMMQYLGILPDFHVGTTIPTELRDISRLLQYTITKSGDLENYLF